MADGNEELNCNFYFTEIHFRLNTESHVWLIATTSESADWEGAVSGNKLKPSLQGIRSSVQKCGRKPLSPSAGELGGRSSILRSVGANGNIVTTLLTA